MYQSPRFQSNKYNELAIITPRNVTQKLQYTHKPLKLNPLPTRRQNHSKDKEKLTLPQLYPEFHSSSLNSSYNGTSMLHNKSRKLRVIQADKTFKQVKQLNWGQLDLPVTPAYVLQNYSQYLTQVELSEILNFKKIYYIGSNATKAQRYNPTSPRDQGNFNYALNDHIYYRYEIQELVGKGSFGQVFRCYDYKTNKIIAIKLLKNKRRYFKQGLMEIKILQHLKKVDFKDNYNIIHIYKSFSFRNHLCMSFELLSSNLFSLIKLNNFKGISFGLIRRFAIQVLVALQAIHNQQIIHCDIKPENILLRQQNKSGVKLIDFGTACYSSKCSYTYIQSRFYRAPEVILGIKYGTEIDMWSFGCLLAELFIGYPLFPGENENDQLLHIMEAKGLPPISMIEQSTRKSKFFYKNGEPIIKQDSRGKTRIPESQTIQEKVNSRDSNFLDLINCKFQLECLEWLPEKRLTASQAINHPWIIEGLPKKARKVSTQQRQAGFHSNMRNHRNNSVSL